MTVTTRPKNLSQAESWAQSLWDSAEIQWSERMGQDKNYRSRVVHPLLDGIISELNQGTSRNIIDLGCGDGVISDDEHFSRLIGSDGRYLGIDINPSLLASAERGKGDDTFSYLRINLTDPTLPDAVNSIGITWDIIISVFVVQEIANIGAFFGNLAEILGPRSYAVIVTVHPGFAEWLKSNGRLKTVDSLSADSEAPWRWVGEYPIVDEYQGTFHLPHFQRTLDEYRKYASSAGLTVSRTVDIPDTPAHLAAFCGEGFAPFRHYPENLYWPAIGKMPSSVAMIIKQETTDA